MDEIDLIKKIKKILIFYFKAYVGFGVFCIFLALLGSLFGANDASFFEIISYSILMFLICLIPPVFMVLLCLVISIIKKILNPSKPLPNNDITYFRDIPEKYSPALCSLIYDLKVDVYKDYTSTLLYLYLKNYINIEKFGNNYSIYAIPGKDFSNLGKCEKYVLTCLLANKNIFDLNQFKLQVIKEARDKNLITNVTYSKSTRIIFIVLVAILLLFISYKINIYLFVILFTLCATPLYVIFFVIPKLGIEYKFPVNTEYHRTIYGRKLAIHLKGLKQYIKDYTLIQDKNIDYIQILEYWIPYSISLDEADAIENYLKHHEEFRDLIYNRSHIPYNKNV